MNSKRPFYFNIDVVGACNLKCPSCPQGNSRDVPWAQGFMDPNLLRQIMVKATRDCDVVGVGLFNWAEPTLHPKLGELVEIVQSFGVPCHISSNLNHLGDIESVFAKNPAQFRISVSGFNQATYGHSHEGGDIEVVKANMKVLAEAKAKTGATTQVLVFYHRYLGNLDEEIAMRAYAAQLGFDFTARWAFLMPLEKVLAFIEQDGKARQAEPWRERRKLRVLSGAESTPPVFTAKDAAIVERFSLPIRPALEIAKRYSHIECNLRDGQTTIDFQGNTMLCCAVYDAEKYALGPYLDIPQEALQAKKHAHSACDSCMNNGIHAYFTYAAPEFQELGDATLAKRYGGLGVGLGWNARPEIQGARAAVRHVRATARWMKRGIKQVLSAAR